ncbi:MAG: class I SAM-dependent methyltransferase, partial [Nitrospirota bacterium]|nr:class I SAM-dependent methyltransferase [Nitrospirota bacterium]
MPPSTMPDMANIPHNSILIASSWEDYALIDSGHGRRLERWGEFTLDRPDPQVLWRPALPEKEWGKVDARFDRKSDGSGAWTFNRSLPERWNVRFEGLSFYVKPTTFKHTGLFPEQTVNWSWLRKLIGQAEGEVSVLNLFGYTGGATLAAAAAGAKVTHVDASKGSIKWARENQELSGLVDKPVRWIMDDAMKFVEREVRRGKKYQGIIMDPPPYGRGPDGELWKIEKDLTVLLEHCEKLLEAPLFILINTYATDYSGLALHNCLLDFRRDFGGAIESGELAIEEEAAGRLLPSGIFA